MKESQLKKECCDLGNTTTTCSTHTTCKSESSDYQDHEKPIQKVLMSFQIQGLPKNITKGRAPQLTF